MEGPCQIVSDASHTTLATPDFCWAGSLESLVHLQRIEARAREATDLGSFPCFSQGKRLVNSFSAWREEPYALKCGRLESAIPTPTLGVLVFLRIVSISVL